jgi:hypothetical protein
MKANLRGLHVEHGQIIHATRAAPLPALQPRGVHHVQSTGHALDARVQRDNRVGAGAIDCDRGAGHA